MIVLNKVSDRDKVFNLYRDIEIFDIKVMIRFSLVIGVGFGVFYLCLIVLLVIVDFELVYYIIYNLMLWVWMKMGVGGFVVMLFMFGTVMRMGVWLVL